MDDLFLASMIANITSVPLNNIAAEDAAVFDRLRALDPVKSSATFGGLLLVPELQSNCVRLEVLTHLALAMGRGKKKPSDEVVKNLYATAGEGVCGRCEDPAEDVFVSSVMTPRGNFRVLEGTWESAGYFLQRVMNVLENFPGGGSYEDMKDCVYSFLRLSDLICERAKLVRHHLGSDIGEPSLPAKIAGRLNTARRLVHFSDVELEEAGISIEHLSEFVFDPPDRTSLLDESLGNSTLERYPILCRNRNFYFVLPTAVTVAIRRYVVERMDALNLREAFLGYLALEYGDTFSRVPLLGGRIGAPIEFKRTEKCMFAGVMYEVERGRFLHFVFFVDTLNGFEHGGMAGFDPDIAGIDADVIKWIEHAYNAATKHPNFRDGITLLVGCGIGRGIAYALDPPERPNWRLESISAADLYTLSWVPDFKPLSLWRMLEGQDKIQSLGVTLQNINGLLNMVAWERELNGHLIPHAQLPDDFAGDPGSFFIMIDQNGLRDLRHEVAICWDAHAEQNIDGRWVRVRKDTQSPFEEDRKEPLYVSEEKPDGRWIPAVYVTAKRPWWCEIEVSDETSGHYAYQRWKMMTTWLARAVPVLETGFPSLPDGALLWRARFEGAIGNLPDDTQEMTFADAKALLSVSADTSSRILTITAAPRFEEAHFNEDNIAEQALVEVLVEGTARLAGCELQQEELSRLVAAIVPDNRARQTHMFRIHGFRDYVQASLPRKPIVINESDAATIKLGLGWRVHDRTAGSRIEGKPASLQYLSDLVKLIENELCQELRGFNRRVMIRLCLLNHEAAIIDRELWGRTSAALLSLHRDKKAAMAVLAEHDFELNAVFQATRLLVEIAICECPLTEGQAPSESDMSRLMARMMMIQQFGGWSDAMRWDVMEPLIRITPLGDVHAKLGFFDDVMVPFARAASDVRVTEAVEKYPTHLASLPSAKPAENMFDSKFHEAWRDETGASLDELRIFMDILDNLGIKEMKAVFVLPKSRLLAARTNGEGLSEAAVSALIDFMSFQSRPDWKIVPAGLLDSDRQPWRFRRRLSVLRRPLMQIDDAEDPSIMVAPGLVRDAVTYMVGNYHRGDFPARQLKKSMRIWAGSERDRTGRKFGLDVGARLKELGWQVDTEVKITKLLRQGFERDFGDVDVLAWHPISGRVLIIECKDVQYRKTYGEIAEQLADFRGDISSDGKPDYLRRHLDRVDLITGHLPTVAKYLGLAAVGGVESHLVFKNPVPMEFALKHMAQRVSVGIFDRLDNI